MLRLLRDKGLVGEPTMAKCRELKMKMQAKREIDELDTSVILDTESENGNIILCVYRIQCRQSQVLEGFYPIRTFISPQILL